MCEPKLRWVRILAADSTISLDPEVDGLAAGTGKDDEMVAIQRVKQAEAAILQRRYLQASSTSVKQEMELPCLGALTRFQCIAANMIIS